MTPDDLLNRNQRPWKRRSPVAAFGYLAVLFLCLFTAAAVTRFAMISLRDRLLSSFQNSTGYEISYSSIAPAVFQNLEIHDAAVTSGRAGEKRSIAAVRNIRIHYDLFTLLFAADKLRAIVKIEIQDGQASLDAEKDRPLLDFLRTLLGGSNNEFRFSERFAFSARNISLVYVEGGRTYALRNLFASAAMEESFLRFSLHTRGETGAVNAPPDLEALLETEGKLKKDISVLDADFHLHSLAAGGMILKKQQFRISLKDRILDITKVQDRSPLDLSFRYDVSSGVFSGSLFAVDFTPGSLLFFSDRHKDLRPLLDARISADGTLRYDLHRDDLRFAVTLDGSLPKSASPVEVSVHSRITGSKERIEFSPLSVSSSLGRFNFTGNVLLRTNLPEGRLTFSDVKTSFGDDFNAELGVSRTERSVALTGERVTIGTAGFRSFLLNLIPGRGEVQFALDAALDLPVEENSITLRGSVAYEHDPRVSLEGGFVSVPLNFPYRVLAPADRFSSSLDRSLGSVLWTTRFSFATDFRSYLFQAPDISLQDRSNAANRLTFDVSASDEALSVSSVQGSWGGYALGGDAAVRWCGESGFDFSAGLAVNGEKYAFNGRFIPGTGVVMSGSYGFSFMLVPQPGGGEYLALAANSLPLPVEGVRLSASLDWIGSLSAVGDFSLVSRMTRIEGIPRLGPGMGSASVDVRFSFTGNRLAVAELAYRDATSSLSGNGNIDVDFFPEPRAEGWLYLADENNSENYTALVALSPQGGDASVFFGNSPLARWGDFGVRGSLNGKLFMRGPLSAPVIDVSVAMNNGRWNGEPIALHTDLTLSQAGLDVRSFEGSFGRNLKILSGGGSFDAGSGEIDFKAVVAAGIRQTEADIAFYAKIDDYRRDEPPADVLDRPFRGKFSVVSRGAKNGEPAAWAVDFFSDSDGYYVSGGPDDVLIGMLRRDGSFRFDLTPPFPLQGHFEGRLTDNRIEAHADDLVVFMPAVNEIIDTPFFVIKDGVIRGRLMVTGPAVDPDFFGELTVEKLGAVSAALADPIGPISSVIEINAKKAIVRMTETKAGNCPLSVYAESVIDHWNISNLAIRIAILDPVGVRLTLPIDILSVDGFVTTPGLTLSVDQSGVSIDGSLFVQKCDVVFGRTNEATRRMEPEEGNLIVNLSLKTGKQVELYWPARVFPILRMTAEPGAALSVTYNQLKDEFSLNGKINFKGGEVFYFERNFIIREGSLSLQETQLDFNPLLNLKAERRIRYNDRDVKITMSVPHQHLKDFAPVFESDPPLPITERYMALGGVIQPPEPGNKEYFTSIVSDIGGDVLSQLILLHPLEKKMKQLLNLDGFSIRTQFISNLILDTVFPNEKNLAADTTISMGRYLNNTEISFQKYLDERNNLFFETVVRIRADLARVGGTELSQAFGNINVESEFSLELTTPFFLTIKWSITPEHWETFFLPDNKITFKWGMSF